MGVKSLTWATSRVLHTPHSIIKPEAVSIALIYGGARVNDDDHLSSATSTTTSSSSSISSHRLMQAKLAEKNEEDERIWISQRRDETIRPVPIIWVRKVVE